MNNERNPVDPDVLALGSENLVIEEWSPDSRGPSATVPHWELPFYHNVVERDQTVSFCGSRFVTLIGEGPQLEHDLVQFMIDHCRKKHGHKWISPPSVARREAFVGVGQLPKFEDQLYHADDGLCLITTGEVPLVNMVANKLLKHDNLPLRYVAHTKCFRKEAGASGRDTHGLVRLHEFSKVEAVSIVEPSESPIELETLRYMVTGLLKLLGLPYRVLLLCEKETGYSSAKTYDVEVWMPGMQQWLEISSISNCRAYQAQNLQARYKDRSTDKNHKVHTLNASCLPLGRTIAALMESRLCSDGQNFWRPNKMEQCMNYSRCPGCYVDGKCYRDRKLAFSS